MPIFGFNGIHLDIPESYNLIKSRGDCRKGELVLGPHDHGELVIHYQTSNNPDLAKLEKEYFESDKTRTLESKAKLDQSRTTYVYREGDSPTTAVLIPKDSQNRTVRLLWLNRKSVPKDDMIKLTAPLLKPDKGHQWAFFYVDMLLPSNWLLTDSVLNAGCYHLEFKKKRHSIHAWGFTMFPQLLGQRDVPDWAKSFLDAKFPKRYRWKFEPKGEGSWAITGRMRFRWWMNFGQLLKVNLRVKGAITLRPDDNQAYMIIHTGGPRVEVDKPISFKGEPCLTF